ncbi:hypothetical protein E3Q11_01060 [Wallemia mellicola]|nr:hypothetical protein E3Q11_01060 [Wallemia mellicola]
MADVTYLSFKYPKSKMDEITIADAFSNRLSIDVERSLIHQDILTPPTSSTSTNFSVNSRTSDILQRMRASRVIPPQKPAPRMPLPPVPSHPYANPSSNYASSLSSSQASLDRPSHKLGAPSTSSAQSLVLLPNFDEWSVKSSNMSTHDGRESRQSTSKLSKRKSKAFSLKIRNFFKE